MQDRLSRAHPLETISISLPSHTACVGYQRRTPAIGTCGSMRQDAVVADGVGDVW
jgi:hypothetical protein